MKPSSRPQSQCFSSGPCAKRPGWSLSALQNALVGRSHRSTSGRARIQEVIDRSKILLGVPADYHLGVVPASDTGAMEMAMWSLLGARGVDVRATNTSYQPAWPLPKIFRMTKNGKFSEAIFKADTINTPSMLVVEDALDGLKWAEGIGGLPELIRRSEDNLAAVAAWVERTPWVDFLAEDPATRSCTSMCLKIVDPWFVGLPAEEQARASKKVASLLDDEGVAYDIAPYREAPPGIRIWGGATVERSDLEALFPWLDWAYAEVKGG